jgi:L-alanine-DL-glutamate epimerase-like enolase superfamily enzyme
MTDLTIKAIRTTTLRVPWPKTPWLKGHAFGDSRGFLVLEVETKGGITGMGYLFLFRPAMKTIAACLEETIIPRVIGKDASAASGPSCRCTGCGEIIVRSCRPTARAASAAPVATA